MAHFIPTHTSADAVKLLKSSLNMSSSSMNYLRPSFLTEIPSLHPSSENLCSRLWKLNFALVLLSTRKLMDKLMLRHYVDERPSAWTKYLPIVEFAYNSTKHSATDRSPFSLVFGKDPDSPLTLSLCSKETQVEASAALLKFLHAA